MATLAAQISATGISAPGYADILQQLKIAYWGIYGSDAQLGADTQDGQFLAIIAKAIDDNNQMAIAVYNSYRPGNAVGVGLSSIVKINGIARKIPTNSQVVVTIVGAVGTPIVNGLVGDNLNLGTKWALPDVVNIPNAGTIDVTATSTTAGAVQAPIGSLTRILTPTAGWQTVNNAAIAVPGQPVESDAELRIRQTKSTSLPALTVLEAIFSALANLAGVRRLQVYENDTGAVDANGIPAHSIAAVVEGGDTFEIASAIASKKSPGTGTFGAISEVVVDSNGVPNTIHFNSLSEVLLNVTINISALNGYVSSTGDLIKAAVVAYLSSLDIGQASYLNRLYTPAGLVGDAAVAVSGLTQAQLDVLGKTFHVTSVLQARSPGAPAAADLAMAFNEAAFTLLANVTLNVA